MRAYQISEQEFKAETQPGASAVSLVWTTELENSVKSKRGKAGEFCAVPENPAAYSAALTDEDPSASGYEGGWAFYFVERS